MVGHTKYIRSLFLLCVLSSTGLIASHLALVDVFLGVEPDLSMEWSVIRVGFGLQVLLVLGTLGLIWKLARKTGV
ncbi:MAG: hypothetical protein GTO14_15600 [Anaerolineales bacterium]|nr:hypothetical protein [Anaerolineales bacterium]